MRSYLLLSVVFLFLFIPGCFSLKIGTKNNPDRLQVDGLATGYVSASAIKAYDGEIVNFGLFKNTPHSGEVVSLDIWPVFGIGVGIVGTRVRILPLEIGVGVLFYNPKAPTDKTPKTTKTSDPPETSKASCENSQTEKTEKKKKEKKETSQ